MNIHFVIVCLRSANAELIMCKFHEALADKKWIDYAAKEHIQEMNAGAVIGQENNFWKVKPVI